MNGNELANVLRWPKGQEYQHEWQAGQQLPEEWWKSDFPYGEAERMGYKLSPEETKKFYERKKKEKEKTLSEELADILKRPEVKMLDPLQRADLIDKIAKAQAVIAKREEEREKHEAAQLEIGRQTQMQDRVKAILQSDRVPAQKVTALTMAGIPLTDARDMVWGKRAPGEEAGRAGREAAPTARAKPTGEELVEGLRPEKRGVQFRMVGGELVKEPAGIWEEERLTPEQKIAKETAEREKTEYYRTLAVKREHPEMFVPLEEREFTARIEREKNEFNLELAKFGHTKEIGERTADLARDEFLLQVKKHGLQVAKEKTGDEHFWAEFGLEDRESQEAAVLATKEFALDVDKFGLDEAVKRHGMEMKAATLKLDTRKQEDEMKKWQEAQKQWTKTFGADEAKRMFDEKMRGLDFEAKVKEEDRQYELNVEEFGEEKAGNLRSFNLDKLKGDRTWEETLFNMGFKDKEFVESSRRFWGELDFNKEKEETRAKEFDVDVEWDKEKEANVMDRFEAKLEQEYKTLDLDIKRFGLNEEIEARIAKMALLQFTLDEKKLGLDEAVAKWKRIAEKKEWYFREEELKLKDTQAQRLFKELMHRITQDAKEFGLKEAIHKENMRQFDEKQKVEWKKLEGTPEAKIEIGGSFGVDLSGLGTELQNEVMGYIKSTYNPKTGKTFFPSATYMKQIDGFLFDTKDGKKKKEELGCNLTSTDYMKAVAKQPWPEEVKGWCIIARYNENTWQGVREAGSAEDVYISPEEAMKPGLWEKITDWWPFGKEKKKPTEVNFPTVKTYVDMLYDRTKSMAEVERYLKEDVGITLDEYKEWLRGRK